MTSSILENKGLVTFREDLSLIRKIKSHLATCQCCKEALKSDNNKEEEAVSPNRRNS